MGKVYDLWQKRYVKKQKENADVSNRMTPNYAVNNVFTNEQKNALTEYIITSSQMFYGLSSIDYRKLAYELAVTNNLKIQEIWHANKMAGIEWLRNFMRRNRKLSLRTPEGCSLARATSFNESNVHKFFDKLYNAMSRHERFSDGTRRFNLNETATVTAKVIAAKGVKQVNKVTSGEKGVLVMAHFIKHTNSSKDNPYMTIKKVTYLLVYLILLRKMEVLLWPFPHIQLINFNG
ncbi:hypothetical protein QE152_g38236 [Popillia japonica]|uniref:HTH CENPB-type domain-containing protein n=1 Tax=Popillia japonica TaxID=7064 RepID=A0AAW1I7U4_POPJA